MTDTLQKEIDKYTFKIEQEKRRKIAIEQTYSMTQKQYLEAKKQSYIDFQKFDRYRQTKIKKKLGSIKEFIE